MDDFTSVLHTLFEENEVELEVSFTFIVKFHTEQNVLLILECNDIILFDRYSF